jgi:acyl-coenzyme A synthetase/AMP-(fatty) acid ligase
MSTSSSLVQDFLGQAALSPTRDAVVADDRRVTFADLARAAGGVQQALTRTDPLDGPVAILATDAVDRAAAVLGVIATGRAFVLLDPDRSDAALAAAAAPIGARTAIGARAEGPFEWVIPPAELSPAELRPVSVPLETPMAYVSTSGSTGDPRYVIRTHAVAVDPPGPGADLLTEDRAFQPLNPSGASLNLLMGCLASGVTHLSVDPRRHAVTRIIEFLHEERVSFISATPSWLRLLARASGPLSGARLEALRLIAAGGEALLWSDVAALRGLGPGGMSIVNMYGATEVRIVARRLVTSDEPIRDGVVPVGTSVPGRRIWIDAGEGVPAAQDVVGTIVIEGRFGTIGPTFEDLPNGMQRFRSGDVGELNASGELIHRGRADGVVKVGAVRIVPSAVEDALRRIEGVADTAVIPVTAEDGSVRLIAHVLHDRQAKLDVGRLRAAASDRLVSGAVPSRFVIHEEPFPLLPSGKADVRALVSRIEKDA